MIMQNCTMTFEFTVSEITPGLFKVFTKYLKEQMPKRVNIYTQFPLVQAVFSSPVHEDVIRNQLITAVREVKNKVGYASRLHLHFCAVDSEYVS
jgi:hypothetical protein